MKFPDLSKVITPQDVSTKGSGSYAADYVSWAKVAYFLNTHANGWQFRLRMTAGDSHVWKAPNGTGYIVGYFLSPDGIEAADFPQAIMDNRNNAVVYEKIGARDLTDAHRRALCSAACFTFGLAYQLWAKEKVENPFRDESHTSEPVATPPAASKATKKTAPPVVTEQGKMSEPNIISAGQLKRLMAIAGEHKVTDEQQKAIVTHRFGFSSRKLITTDKYDEVVRAYELVNQQDNPNAIGDGTEFLNN